MESFQSLTLLLVSLLMMVMMKIGLAVSQQV